MASWSFGDNIDDYVVCLKAEFLWHTVLSTKWRVLHIWYISVLEQVGMSFSEIAYLMIHEGLAFVQAGVPSCSDDVMHCSCANFKCEVADVNNGIPIDFRAINCVLVESGQPCCDNISWYIQYDQFVQQLFHKVPSACCVQHLIDSCHCLWITVDSLWHWTEREKALDWCQLYFSGKYLIWELINVSFLIKKMFTSNKIK